MRSSSSSTSSVVARRSSGSSSEQLEVAAADRERVAELVVRVLDELALALEDRLEPVEHRVEAARHVGGLSGPADLDPLREVGLRDRVRRLGEQAHRREHAAGDEPGERRGEQEDADASPRRRTSGGRRASSSAAGRIVTTNAPGVARAGCAARGSTPRRASCRTCRSRSRGRRPCARARLPVGEVLGRAAGRTGTATAPCGRTRRRRTRAEPPPGSGRYGRGRRRTARGRTSNGLPVSGSLPTAASWSNSRTSCSSDSCTRSSSWLKRNCADAEHRDERGEREQDDVRGEDPRPYAPQGVVPVLALSGVAAGLSLWAGCSRR